MFRGTGKRDDIFLSDKGVLLQTNDNKSALWLTLIQYKPTTQRKQGRELRKQVGIHNPEDAKDVDWVVEI